MHTYSFQLYIQTAVQGNSQHSSGRRGKDKNISFEVNRIFFVCTVYTESLIFDVSRSNWKWPFSVQRANNTWYTLQSPTMNEAGKIHGRISKSRHDRPRHHCYLYGILGPVFTSFTGFPSPSLTCARRVLDNIVICNIDLNSIIIILSYIDTCVHWSFMTIL